ncbi:MAG: CoA transferase subunit A, partial [Alteromonas macleodii]|nr:CoA transferase subunit A [Alteromonas macleodii]
TVEEIVDDLEAGPNSCVLPAWTINAIATVPFGAKPSYTHGYYPRDNSYYKRWDSISREREPFLKWLDEEVFQAGE